MSTLTNQGDSSKVGLNPELEVRYLRRLLDTLLTIPAEYWKPVTRRVAEMVEKGYKPGTTKYVEP